MGRIMSFVLAIATLLSILVGCKQETPTPSETETEAPLGAAVEVFWFTEKGDFLTAGNVGRTPTPPEIEKTIMTEKFVYTFTGWDKELAPIQDADVKDGAVYYHAVYEKSKRMYNVSFVANGETLQTL